MWSTRIVRCIGLLLDPLIPVVPVTIERTNTVAIDTDIVASENESCGLILIPNGKGRVQPVLDICAPLIDVRHKLASTFRSEAYKQLSLNINVNVFQVDDVQN